MCVYVSPKGALNLICISYFMGQLRTGDMVNSPMLQESVEKKIVLNPCKRNHVVPAML